MSDGAFILVFTPDGQCLTAAATRHGPTARLAGCHLGPSQRWSHPTRAPIRLPGATGSYAAWPTGAASR